ncbi:MAG: MFS transporter [Candidatus Omnitrophica bacterium]|nr:MFS transporter [Candidatus Omnitrophota bacterium]
MPEHKIKKSLKNSFWDGFFACCMTGFTTEYITPYALALKAQVSQIGLLSALPNLVSSLVQLKSADVTRKSGSRKRIICLFVFLQALTGIPIILIPFLFKGYEVFALIFFVTLFTSFQGFANPIWASLMSDHLPRNKRGRYFGWRNTVLGIVGIVCLYMAGFVLQKFKQHGLVGFFIIFGAATACRFVSWYFVTKMYEPPQHVRPDSYFSFFDFLRRAKDSNFARFVFFSAALHFCVYIAAPFFSVFMLRDLKFSYITYTVLQSIVSLVTILTIGRWGRSADRVGNVKVLRITSLFIASLPLWWVVCRHPVYLLFAQAVSGMAWAGFNLCALNFIYDVATPAKRTRCISYFYFFNGFAIFFGSIVGGYLADRMPQLFGYRLLSLFVLASICRLAVAIFVAPGIKEVRPVEHVSSRDLVFSVVGLRPAIE